jgi:hypothetical protein
MLTHASNMAAILSVSCALLVSFARENRRDRSRFCIDGLKLRAFGARQPAAAGPVPYWAIWGLGET